MAIVARCAVTPVRSHRTAPRSHRTAAPSHWTPAPFLRTVATVPLKACAVTSHCCVFPSQYCSFPTRLPNDRVVPVIHIPRPVIVSVVPGIGSGGPTNRRSRPAAPAARRSVPSVVLLRSDHVRARTDGMVSLSDDPVAPCRSSCTAGPPIGRRGPTTRLACPVARARRAGTWCRFPQMGSDPI
jgi:hypothetical protein